MSETAIVERPVKVRKNGNWLPGAIVSMDAGKGRVRIRYTSANGKVKEFTTDPRGNEDVILTRGSTLDGSGVTGKRFPRTQKTHVCSTCEVRKDARSFPTDGPDSRLGECRECRDGRTLSGLPQAS
jgi:hypothetical protein